MSSLSRIYLVSMKVWSEQVYLEIAQNIKENFPFAHYFHSGKFSTIHQYKSKFQLLLKALLEVVLVLSADIQ
jgi:hypothetical protein